MKSVQFCFRVRVLSQQASKLKFLFSAKVAMENKISHLMIYITKVVDSDWLGAVPFDYNTRAKCNTSHVIILPVDYDRLNENKKFSKPCLNC